MIKKWLMFIQEETFNLINKNKTFKFKKFLIKTNKIQFNQNL